MTLANLLVFAPAFLILIGAILSIRKSKHGPAWITLIGATVVVFSGAIRTGIGSTCVMTGPSDAAAIAQLKWLDALSTLYMAGWGVIAAGYLLESLRGEKK